MMGRLLMLLAILVFIGIGISNSGVEARRILLDNDVDTDDVFALMYLLKQDKSVIDLKAVTINANSWTDAGHAVNLVYDVLYMMGRDDIPVGVGGEGGILPDGTLQKNVGGYLPIIDQGLSTVGNCRYRQAIPLRAGGRLDIDTNYGLRRGFLPQGKRKYSPLRQPTAQQVLIDTISAGPTTVFITGAQTNLAIFLMSNPHLTKNIEHIFIMGGGVRSSNPTGCCPKDAGSSCVPTQCGDRGNLFSGYVGNPYAEFNMFCDPFAAYQVLHSGIPITLVPLDATNTIPITRKFLKEFERRQHTYEAQYCLQSLKIIHDTWFDDQFYTSYFMWDSFMSGVAASIIRNGFPPDGQNEFAEMTYLNITVVTSNEPYGVSDGSNPFFDGRRIPKFNLEKGGVHSGHVQMGIQDPFCIVNNGTETGRCQDGYTKEISGPDAVQVLVAQKAKPNQNTSSPLNRQFFADFLDVLNNPRHSGLFNFVAQFPFYKPTLYKPDFSNRTLGKPLVFDTDMSAGDFITLIYLLKVPVENIDLRGILVSGTGWANAATIDVVYDVLHMMGRDDIPVGLGSATPVGSPSFGCKYVKAIPHGSGGFLDSDTLFGLARNLPRSPRRYSAENSVAYGAPRNTSHPSRRQPLALEVWRSITSDLHSKGGQKITVLTNGPLTNLANIILTDKNATSLIQEVYTVGGHVTKDRSDIGNVFTVPSNKYSEFNFFLDPIAADTVLKSKLRVTLIPLGIQRTVASFPLMLGKFQSTHGTPEAMFTRNLLSTMYSLQRKNRNYYHMEMFLGEILGAVFLANDPILQTSTFVKSIAVLVGDTSRSGQTVLRRRGGNKVKILNNLDSEAYYNHFTNLLCEETHSAVVGSFEEQTLKWSKRTNVYRESENGSRPNIRTLRSLSTPNGY